MNAKYLLFDTETEDTNLTLSRPWQFAAILTDEREILESHNLLIDIPDLNVSRDAARITGFNQHHYDRNKRPLEECCDIVEELLLDESVFLVGHNILGFDVYQIQNMLNLLGRRLPWSFLNRCIDTHCLARGLAYNSTPPKTQPDFLLWSYKMLHRFQRGVKTSLGYLSKEYEIPLDESKQHDALYDIYLNFEVFKKIKYEIDLDLSL